MADSKHLDAQALQELKQVMGDDFLLLVETFLNDSRVRLSALGEAIEAGDGAALQRSAHSFKGSASNMAAPQLAELCKQLEDIGREGPLEAAPPLYVEVQSEYQQVLVSLQALT